VLGRCRARGGGGGGGEGPRGVIIAICVFFLICVFGSLLGYNDSGGHVH